MLNFFKNLFGGSGEAETNARGNGNGNGYAGATATPAAPVQVHARPVVPQQKPQPALRPQPSMPAAAGAPQSFSNVSQAGNGVTSPLHTIIAVLPLELKTRIQQTMVAEINVTIPLDRILIQLGSGSVRMSYGELRALAPNVFSNSPDLDQSEFALPLNEILPQINPALIARRMSQKHVQVPEDIHGPFGKDLAGVAVADLRSAAKPMAASPAPMAAPKISPRPVQANPVPMNPIPMKPAPMTPPAMKPVPMAPPTPMPSPAAIRPAQPIAPAQPLKPATPVPFKPAAPATPAPTPANDPDPIPMVPFRSSITSTPTPRPPTATPPAAPPVRPVMPASRGVGATPLPAAASRLPVNPGNGNGNGNGRAASVPHTPQAMPAAAAAQEASLAVPLRMLSESWPEVLRSEIQQLNLTEAAVALPVRFVEPALKQGKVGFTWKVLRSWIRPATLPTVSAHDGMMLELPLPVIAPLFLTRHKQAPQPAQRVQVDENIPNLFFGFPQGESAADTLEEQAVAPAPVEPVALVAPVAPAAQEEEPEANFAPTVKQTKAGSADTNFYVWGETSDAPQVDESAEKKATPGTDFLSRYATPNEVVSRAAALEGVAGALIALPDGLMVASQLPADLNGDTLAAFLPQIFGKVSQCTKELRMGELNNLNFTVGNVPWKIFRVNAVYLRRVRPRRRSRCRPRNWPRWPPNSTAKNK